MRLCLLYAYMLISAYYFANYFWSDTFQELCGNKRNFKKLIFFISKMYNSTGLDTKKKKLSPAGPDDAQMSSWGCQIFRRASSELIFLIIIEHWAQFQTLFTNFNNFRLIVSNIFYKWNICTSSLYWNKYRNREIYFSKCLLVILMYLK